ncbi:hypothetical protein [Rhizobium sp. YTU87027]|uniref:hypothetical protein n=1 Tax=Rhizobium sp. YTU87027 TaxID=3417741 RepID=UPI003D69CCAB
MYEPVLLAEYRDGRRVFQFEIPDGLSSIFVDKYYYVNIVDDDKRAIQRGILYIAKEQRDILGKVGKPTAFYVTDESGNLDVCVYRDGGCVAIERPLSPDEIELEGQKFKDALNLGRI